MSKFPKFLVRVPVVLAGLALLAAGLIFLGAMPYIAVRLASLPTF